MPALSLSRVSTQANVLLPGTYAWLATVAWPTATAGAPRASWLSCGAALLLLVLGAAVAPLRPRIGAWLGIVGFVSTSVATWLLLGSALDHVRPEPVEATLGGVGWVLYVLGWGSLRETRWSSDTSPVDRPGSLSPRHQPARGAGAVIAAAAVAACSVLFWAWSVAPPAHGLLAQAAAVGCSLWLVTAATRIALAWGGRRKKSAQAGWRAPPLGNLVVIIALIALGLLWTLKGSP